MRKINKYLKEFHTITQTSLFPIAVALSCEWLIGEGGFEGGMGKKYRKQLVALSRTCKTGAHWHWPLRFMLAVIYMGVRLNIWIVSIVLLLTVAISWILLPIWINRLLRILFSLIYNDFREYIEVVFTDILKYLSIKKTNPDLYAIKSRVYEKVFKG